MPVLSYCITSVVLCFALAFGGGAGDWHGGRRLGDELVCTGKHREKGETLMTPNKGYKHPLTNPRVVDLTGVL